MLDQIFYFLRTYIIPKPVFDFFQPFYHWALALLGALVYGFPSRGLTVIGVTGTNGKSTTVEMLDALFIAAGFKTASLSSIRFKIGGKVIENRFKMTMPGRFFVQKFLRDAKRAGTTHVILEVTSEGIKQFRHKYIRFVAAVLTNLTPEHIEAHGGFENYKKAKGELFRALGGLGVSVVNLADTNAEYFLSFPAKEYIGYTLEGRDKIQATRDKKQEARSTKQELRVIVPVKYEINESGIQLHFGGDWEIFAPLAGKFNAENVLAAIAVGETFGISHDTMRKAFAEFRGAPGRMEEIQREPFRVIVDYAFTPNALRQVYETLSGKDERPAVAKAMAGGQETKDREKRLICVLGAAGGGRDKWKRPELGKIAGEYCSHIIITNEDPYDEDPRSIMEEVRGGVEMRNASCEIIEDRRIAIRGAIAAARPGDTVIITGKGSESSIAAAGGMRVPWDDRMAAREELERKIQATNKK
ncbi:MAG: UDP-N-acetylmuramoyl-L-alanyl-D-glutamate-2,6-diaminopimelate ligase [Parcubacteria group bacterium GW2011_GWB1_52_7]|nr:MAG: UDP-N-acetylmuramoyl-L-alanyl-D-glutamate-2,6-diaminopimelate ligase [Parcubacteria group bacterium GW2011_GWB1_52_7]KKW31763.1 MAG: UDP-N-acetylmuramoyl-L-alanyl-D-glutamate-2,6-diaminopimelate ligase [Parcubacteria group bacterium GW2011_GWC2_52_8c]